MNKFYDIYDDLIRAGIVKDYGEQWKGKHMLMTIRERRIGKSTSINRVAEENWLRNDHNCKILYIRNTQEELDAFAKTFNVKYANKYLMTKTHIFKIECDMFGKELKKERKIIGLCGAISTFAKLKSLVENTNFNLVIWDEFNGVDGVDFQTATKFYQSSDRNMFFNFCELISSIEGDSKDLLVVLIGNKVNSQNDILLNFGIEIPEEAPKTSELTTLDREIEGTTFKIRFINGGSNEYPNVHSGNQLFKAIASYNKQCERYFAGNDFYIKQSYNVISKNRMDQVEGDISFLALNNTLIAMIEGEDGNYYLHEWYDKQPSEANIFPMNFLAFTEFQNCVVWDKKEQQAYAISIIDNIKDGKVFFASNWLKYNFLFWLGKVSCFGAI